MCEPSFAHTPGLAGSAGPHLDQAGQRARNEVIQQRKYIRRVRPKDRSATPVERNLRDQPSPSRSIFLEERGGAGGTFSSPPSVEIVLPGGISEAA